MEESLYLAECYLESKDKLTFTHLSGQWKRKLKSEEKKSAQLPNTIPKQILIQSLKLIT